MASDPQKDWVSPLDTVTDAHAVLLLAPTDHGETHPACLRLSTVEPTDETGMVWVTFVESADDRLGKWLDGIGDLPASSSVVVVGGAGREVTVTDPGNVRVERVRDASDLTRLGITISSVIEELNPDLRPVVCFHSVTTLLQYAEVERVFRFLNVLNDRVRKADGAIHHHLDPATVDERTVATLKELVDAVLEITPDGEYHIK